MLRISIKFKDSVIKTIETDSEKITIGRHEKNNIQIDNLAVSSLHARIVKEDDNYYIEDLDSTNGTFLNDAQVKREQLKDTDAITIGKHAIIINIFPDRDGSVTDIDPTYAL
jgi:pSer/pThr/pTyr-binding forkhead associated (FHA) protein